MKALSLGLLCLTALLPGRASTLDVPALAMQTIASYRDLDRSTYLDNRFRLDIAAEHYADALNALSELHRLRGGATPQSRADGVPYAIYARARLAAGSGPFARPFRDAFISTFAHLDDRASALVVRAFVLVDPVAQQQSLDRMTAHRRPDDALAIVRAYVNARVFHAAAPLTPALIAADDRRRYAIARDLLVKTPDGARICVLVVRPRRGAAKLPALLNFTVYADRLTTMSEARRTASNGYAGVEGLTRGMGCSPDAPVPYEHDGADADTVIEWIARQPWSDGRVGMYGGSYEGFTQWAAAKHRPRALLALMPSVTNAPGIDTPMEGNIHQTFSYNWPLYVTAGKWLDSKDEGDPAGITALTRKWYLGGSAYAGMDRLGGPPNPLWDRWLEHPAYDGYWQAMVPYKTDFARLHIPVLTTSGYFDGGQIGALYYFDQYRAYAPTAENYLVIGPYDHIRGQRGTVSALGDPILSNGPYRFDAVAQLDVGQLRYEWFDYVFKGAPKPAILASRVNYEVMGANVWKHASSLATLGAHRMRFYLSAAPTAGFSSLTTTRVPFAGSAAGLTINMKDRSDIDRVGPDGDVLDTYQAVGFASAPFEKGFELSGLFRGQFDVVTNKRDFDFEVTLYEQLKSGGYAFLGVSYYMTRASYAADRSVRRLLKPGVPRRISFSSGRMTSRRFEPGSRLIAMINVFKESGIEINYGTRAPVETETIAHAGEPLHVEWLGGSYLEIPGV